MRFLEKECDTILVMHKSFFKVFPPPRLLTIPLIKMFAAFKRIPPPAPAPPEPPAPLAGLVGPLLPPALEPDIAADPPVPGLYYLRASTEERHLRTVSEPHRAYPADVDRRWAGAATGLTGKRWGWDGDEEGRCLSPCFLRA